jgi:hypothetical protein
MVCQQFYCRHKHGLWNCLDPNVLLVEFGELAAEIVRVAVAQGLSMQIKSGSSGISAKFCNIGATAEAPDSFNASLTMQSFAARQLGC